MTAPKTAKPKKVAKPKAQPETVTICYPDRHGIEQSHELKVPIRPGSGEAVLNAAERAGTPDIGAVREQIRKHYR